jgi:hypothetical protein
MTLDELKKAAQAILEVQPSAGFAHHTFSTGSGGSPRNDVGIPEVHREDRFAYDTVRNGAAYKGSVTIECRKLGVKDSKGREIYETPEGLVFVYVYYPGCPDFFDYGVLKAPVLAVAEKK